MQYYYLCYLTAFTFICNKIDLYAYLFVFFYDLESNFPFGAQQVDYSIVSVQEESGIEFTPITSASDYVCMPIVRCSSVSLDWFSNRILDISREGTHIASLFCHNNTTNIFIKELNKKGRAVQRTNRSNVYDFSYSPDGLEYLGYDDEDELLVCKLVRL